MFTLCSVVNYRTVAFVTLKSYWLYFISQQSSTSLGVLTLFPVCRIILSFGRQRLVSKCPMGRWLLRLWTSMKIPASSLDRSAFAGWFLRLNALNFKKKQRQFYWKSKLSEKLKIFCYILPSFGVSGLCSMQSPVQTGDNSRRIR